MGTPVNIIGANGIPVSVTDAGELAVADIAHSDSKSVVLDVDDQGYEFYAPISGKQFIVTGIFGKADRDVSTTVDAIVVVYESDAANSTTQDKVLYQDAMVRGERINISPIRLKVRPGKFVNATTSDDDIHMTILGYYIQQIDES